LELQFGKIGDSTWSAFQAAMDLVVDHRFQVWDALIMAVAAENHCRMLLSEDLQNNFIWRGVTVVNPFTLPTSPLLDNVLQTG
jgi:predicted nucleic acid-binding protein